MHILLERRVLSLSASAGHLKVKSQIPKCKSNPQNSVSLVRFLLFED